MKANGNFNIRNISGVVALFCALAVPAAARTSQVEVQWDQLAPLILDRHIAVTTTDGNVVEGDTIAVSNQTLAINVESSGNKQYPKGRASIPKASISEIRREENKGVAGRLLGTALGAVVGLVGSAEITAHSGANSEGSVVPLFTGLWAGSMVGGYQLGKQADRRVTVIHILPGSAADAH